MLKISLLVLNPCFRTEDGILPGEVLSKRIAEAAGGKLLKFRPSQEMYQDGFSPPTPRQISEIFSGISKAITEV